MKVNKLPNVTVIIPLYNAYDSVSETLNSCLNQTYKSIEVIVVDDHSTDNSYEVVKEFQSKYPGIIKLYSNPRKGACAARNYGYIKSSGEYIQYLDADDLLSPNKIESQMKILTINTGLCVSSCGWGRFQKHSVDVNWENSKINKSYSNPIDFLIDCWNGYGTMPIHSWLTPRALVERAGSWNEDLLINQDGEFFSRILFFAKKIKYCAEAKVYYRSGNLNSVSQLNSKKYGKAKSLLESYFAYEETWHDQIENKRLKRALAHNYLSFIYTYYPLHKNLILDAEKHFKNFGYSKMWPVGGNRFKRLARFMGFKNSLKLRSYLNIL